MSDPFLDRLREAIVEPGDVDVDALRAGSVAAASELTAHQALTLVRLAHRQPVGASALTDALNRFNAKGGAVPEQGADQLVATLAGEALIVSFSRTRFATGHVPALAVRCARSAGWTVVHQDVHNHAVSYLSYRSLMVRERAAVPPDPRRPQDAPDGWEPTIDDRVRTIRDTITIDRFVNQEREALSWWLLSNSRPSTPLAIAQEMSSCIAWIPEPLAAREMLRSKLSQPRLAETGGLAMTIPDEIASLCLDISEPISELEGDEEYDTAARCMDQLMLMRAYSEAVKG